MPIMRRAAAALMTSPMIFGHRTGKAVRKARDIPDLPVLETGGNHGGLVYADISALVRLLVRSARQAKIGELLKIERHRRLHGWAEWPVRAQTAELRVAAHPVGARRMQRRRWRSPPR